MSGGTDLSFILDLFILFHVAVLSFFLFYFVDIHNCITGSQRVCLVLHVEVRTSPSLAI